MVMWEYERHEGEQIKVCGCVTRWRGNFVAAVRLKSFAPCLRFACPSLLLIPSTLPSAIT